MARHISTRLGVALALVLLLPWPLAEAQGLPRWRQQGVIVQPQNVPPRPPAKLPNYYFEQGGPLVAPKGGPVPPGEIANSLRARGFNNLGQIQQRGSTTIIPRATGPRGECVQLVVGPAGAILGVQPCAPGQ